jgi:hypothetical protein
MSLRRHLAYARYVARHKFGVLVGAYLVRAGVWAALVHDLSKLLPDEWGPYARNFYQADGSPRRGEPEDSEFKLAWWLHQRRNPHHWQHWLLRNDDGTLTPIPMPEPVVREMVADWIGAGMAIAGTLDPSGWYEHSREKMVLADETRELVESILRALREGKGGSSGM